MPKLSGKCLCGQIAYEVNGDLGPIVNCHCSKCRRWHGSAFRTRAAVKRKDFKWVRGEGLLSRYRSSENNIKTFCSVCGSNLISLYGKDQAFVGLPLGGIEQALEKGPVMNIYVGSKSPWYQICDGLPQYEAEPPSGISSVRSTK